MKPCPFCKQRDIYVTFTYKGTRVPYVCATASCGTCGASGPQAWVGVTSNPDELGEMSAAEDAWRLWNERKQVDEGSVR